MRLQGERRPFLVPKGDDGWSTESIHGLREDHSTHFTVLSFCLKRREETR